MRQAALSRRVAAVLGLAFAAPAAGHAQDRSCAAREKAVERLAQGFGETLQSIGPQSANGVGEVHACEAAGAWTILPTRPDGA